MVRKVFAFAFAALLCTARVRASGDSWTTAQAKALLHQVQTGQIDRSKLTEKVDAGLTPEVASQLAASLRQLGEPASFVLEKKKTQGAYTAYVYRAESKTGAVEENVVLDGDGKVAGLWFRPAVPAPAAGDAAAMARAKTLLRQAQSGTLDRSEFTAQAAAALTSGALAQLKQEMAPLGAASSFVLQSRSKDGTITTYFYRVGFAEAAMYEELDLDHSGKIAGLWFKPSQ